MDPRETQVLLACQDFPVRTARQACPVETVLTVYQELLDQWDPLDPPDPQDLLGQEVEQSSSAVVTVNWRVLPDSPDPVACQDLRDHKVSRV